MLFKEKPLLAFRRPKNLKDQLVKARIEYLAVNRHKEVYQLKNTTCPVITCRYCKMLDKSWKIKSSFTDTIHNMRIG